MPANAYPPELNVYGRGCNLVAQIRRRPKRVERPMHDPVAILEETPVLLEELRIVRLQGPAKDDSARLVEQSCSSHREVARSIKQQFNQWQLVSIYAFPQRGLDCGLASNRSQ